MTDAMVRTLTGFTVGFPMTVLGFVVGLGCLMPLVGVLMLIDAVARLLGFRRTA